MPETIEWTEPMLARFKTAYNTAMAKNGDRNDVFVFDGKEYLVGYARYLIEFLDSEFNKGNAAP